MCLSSATWARCHGVMLATYGPNHSPMPDTHAASCPDIYLCHETCQDKVPQSSGAKFRSGHRGKTRPEDLKEVIRHR